MVILIIFIVASLFSSSNSKENPSNNESYNSYILKEYNGKIAVFLGTNSKPLDIFDVEFSSLPYSDRQELIKGIKADDLKKIYQIAEDFDG